MNLKLDFPPLQPAHRIVVHRVASHQSGLRLDQFLKVCYQRRSREQLKRTIDSGAVTLQRKQPPFFCLGRLKPSLHLLPGDEVRVLSERSLEPEVNLNYQIMYEDEAMFVINKPPQLPVHPAGKYYFNTLLSHLRNSERKDQPCFLVHRLDKETSGVLILAKTKKVCTDLSQQFVNRIPEKRYLAIVHGSCPSFFSVNLPLKRDNRSTIHLKMRVASRLEGGQTCLTHFKKISQHGNYSWIECFPKTGRQHQIRVHLEAKGFPLVGDKLYGLSEKEALYFYERKSIPPELNQKLLLRRHALHASRIQVRHPLTQQNIQFEAPVPEDLLAFLNQQKEYLKTSQDDQTLLTTSISDETFL